MPGRVRMVFTETLIEAWMRGAAAADMTRATGMYRQRLGAAASSPRDPIDLLRAKPKTLHCPSCGAPHEPVRCSYCLTPST